MKLIHLLPILCLTPALSAQEHTVGFDQVTAPGPFHFVFPGLELGPLLEYEHVTLDGGVILWDVLFGHSSTTPENIYATCSTCGLGDGPPPTTLPGEIYASFEVCADQVSLDVINGFGAAGSFTLTGFDVHGTVVASDTVIAQAMNAPGFVQPMSISAPEIASIEVTTTLPQGYTFAIDTLVFREAELGTNYCPLVNNSSGFAAAISARGCTSVSENDLRLSAGPIPANQIGIFYYGPNMTQQVFGPGFRCVGGQTHRLSPQQAEPDSYLRRTIDLANPLTPAGQILPGSTWHFQAWFRDPAAAGGAYGLSDATTIHFGN